MVIFVDRTREIDTIIDGIKTGQSFAVLGMRKIGQTYLMEEIKKQIDRKDGMCACLVKSSHQECFEDVLKDIVNGLRKEYRRLGMLGQFVDFLNGLVQRIEGFHRETHSGE